MNIAVIGIGYWGKNLVRVLDDVAEVRTCCHTGNETNREWLRREYPETGMTTDPEAVFTDPAIDAVVIATPVGTHFELAADALRAGKDVFVEKPLTTSHDRAVELVELAERHGCCLFTGYIFVHHELVRTLREAIDGKRVTALKFSWQKTGDFDQDILLDLVSHPVSIVQHLLDDTPSEVTHASGLPFVTDRDTASVELSYESTAVRIDVDRFSTHDTKSLAVSTADGARYVWDDGSLNRYRSSGGFERIAERTEEPLRSECEAFVRAVETGERPLTDGRFAAEVSHTVERIRDKEAT